MYLFFLHQLNINVILTRLIRSALKDYSGIRVKVGIADSISLLAGPTMLSFNNAADWRYSLDG